MDDRRPHRSNRRPTAGNVVAVLALFLAIGGTSLGAPVREAASSVMNRVADAVRTSHRADANARKALKAAKRAVATAEAAAAGARGPAGPVGPAGQPGRPGDAGSAVGYAAVEYCPTVCLDAPAPGWFAPDDDARGVDNMANFSNPADGVFCFNGLPFHAHNVVASIGPLADQSLPAGYFLQVAVGTTDHPLGDPPCPVSGAPDQNAVVKVVGSNGTPVAPDHKARIMIAFN